MKKPTYCNPMPLPDYQRGPASINKGKSVREKTNLPQNDKWLHEIRRDFREMADPTVIKFKGRWYLFPSYSLIWYSDDLLKWHYQPVKPFDRVGSLVAPTAVEKDGYIYLTGCGDKMWRAKDPFGPWELLGNIRNENGQVT